MENKDKEKNTEQNNQEQKKKDELENLLKAIEEIEKQNKNRKKGKRPRNYFAIEFGGVFHHNFLVNFLFTCLLNFTIVLALIELFNFAEYKDILYLIAFVLTYTTLEQMFRYYVLLNHFQIVIKSVGFIFFFGYIIIYYLLDQFIFLTTFNFISATMLASCVMLFTVTRYILSMIIRKSLR